MLTIKDAPAQETNFSNLDEILKEISTPKQDFTPPAPEPQQRPEPENYNPEFSDSFDFEPRKRLSPEAARRSGERIAKLIDGTFATGASFYARNPGNFEKYAATPGQLEDLSDAWADMAEQTGVEMPPWVMLAILNLTTYLPKAIEAHNDKRFAEVNNRIDKLEREASEREAKAEREKMKKADNKPEIPDE
jgi:hypothetical protein